MDLRGLVRESLLAGGRKAVGGRQGQEVIGARGDFFSSARG